jgi:hypothetical protein
LDDGQLDVNGTARDGLSGDADVSTGKRLSIRKINTSRPRKLSLKAGRLSKASYPGNDFPPIFSCESAHFSFACSLGRQGWE